MAGGSAGPVTFECGTTVLGTVNLSGSDPTYEEAVFTTSALPDGSDTVTAAYNGDDNYNSASTTTSETVQSLQATVNRSTSSNPSSVGQAVTLTASLPAQNGPTPTGTRQSGSGYVGPSLRQ